MLLFTKAYCKDRQIHQRNRIDMVKDSQRLTPIYDNDNPEKERSFNYWVN